MILRSSMVLLRKSQLRHVQKQARKQERAEKQAQRQLEAQKETDTESMHSSTSRGTNSTVVVEETPIVISPNEKLPVPAEHAAEPCTPGTSTPGPLKSAEQPDSQIPMKTNVAEDSEEQAYSKLSTSLNGLGLKISGGMSEWAQKLFGKDDEFSKDWESQELEAWVFQTSTPFSTPMKVPFGHQRLKYGLKQSKSKKKNDMGRTTFARYINGGPHTQT